MRASAPRRVAVAVVGVVYRSLGVRSNKKRGVEKSNKKRNGISVDKLRVNECRVKLM